MGAWLSNISLKYKFWAVNAVAFITTLLLVLYAVQLEQQARSDAAQASAQAQARLLSAWPADKPLPKGEHWLTFTRGQVPQLANQDLSALGIASGWVELNHMPLFGENPLIGAELIARDDGQQVAVLAYGRSLSQVFGERFANYAVAVLILMLAMLGASQLLIRFLLSQLNTLTRFAYHRSRSSLWLAACEVLLMLSLALLVYNREMILDTPASTFLEAFGNGLRLDIRLVVYLLIPLLLALFSVRAMAARGLFRVWLTVASSIALFLGLMEMDFYREFHQRLNGLVFQYVKENPKTVMSMLWYGFPVVRYLLAWAVGTLILSMAFKGADRATRPR